MNVFLLSLIMTIVMATTSILYTVYKNVIENNISPESNNTTVPTIDITTNIIDLNTSFIQETDKPTLEPTTLETTITTENKNENQTTTLETSNLTEKNNDSPTESLSEKTTSEPSIIYYPACDSSYISLVDALKSIGEDSSYSKRKIIAELNGISDYSGTGEQNTELLNKLKEGILIKSKSFEEPKTQNEIKETETEKINTNNTITPFQTIYSQSKINNMIQNLEKNIGKFNSKKETLVIMASVLLNYGYELAFTSGILGNIFGEGQIGKFESSARKDPSTLTKSLKYMNDNYDYLTKYSGKFIFEISLFEIKSILEELEAKGWNEGKFGLGCVQWTGDRTLNLVNYYLKETGNTEFINFEQACSAESKLIIYELDNKYKTVYNNWKKKNSLVDTEDAAYNAGIIFCEEYEKPFNGTFICIGRGNNAKDIYNIMKN